MGTQKLIQRIDKRLGWGMVGIAAIKAVKQAPLRSAKSKRWKMRTLSTLAVVGLFSIGLAAPAISHDTMSEDGPAVILDANSIACDREEDRDELLRLNQANMRTEAVNMLKELKAADLCIEEAGLDIEAYRDKGAVVEGHTWLVFTDTTKEDDEVGTWQTRSVIVADTGAERYRYVAGPILNE